MGIDALVPVQETFHIHSLTNFQSLYSLVNIGVRTAQIRLYSEGISLAVVGNVEVQVIAFRTGAIPVVHESIAVVVGSLYGHTLESYTLVLMLD